MPRVVRQGDKNSAGGRVLRGNKHFIVDGVPIAVDGSPVSAHNPCPKHKKHCHAKTSQGTRHFVVNGIPVNVVGDKDTCGHARIEGSKHFHVAK